MPLKSLCMECKSKQRLRDWDIVGIPAHRDTAEQTSSQEVYVETPIGLRQVYGRRRKCDHGIIKFFVCCLGQFQSVFHFLFLLLLLNLMSSSTLLSLFLWISSRLGQASSVSSIWGQNRIVWPEASRGCLRNLDAPAGWGRVLWRLPSTDLAKNSVLDWTLCWFRLHYSNNKGKNLKYKPKLFWCTKPVNPS